MVWKMYCAGVIFIYAITVANLVSSGSAGTKLYVSLMIATAVIGIAAFLLVGVLRYTGEDKKMERSNIKIGEIALVFIISMVISIVSQGMHKDKLEVREQESNLVITEPLDTEPVLEDGEFEYKVLDYIVGLDDVQYLGAIASRASKREVILTFVFSVQGQEIYVPRGARAVRIQGVKLKVNNDYSTSAKLYAAVVE